MTPWAKTAIRIKGVGGHYDGGCNSYFYNSEKINRHWTSYMYFPSNLFLSMSLPHRTFAASNNLTVPLLRSESHTGIHQKNMSEEREEHRPDWYNEAIANMKGWRKTDGGE